MFPVHTLTVSPLVAITEPVASLTLGASLIMVASILGLLRFNDV
jgi:hypothetical protein